MRFTVLLAIAFALAIGPSSTSAEGNSTRCPRRLLATLGRVVRADLRVLTRCLPKPVSADSLRACRGLFDQDQGIARIDRQAMRALERACPDLCNSDQAQCPLTAGHCAALVLFEEHAGSLEAMPGVNLLPAPFAACFETPVSTTLPTTTTLITSTTTPTTTTSMPAAPSTTVRATTSTTLEPTTTTTSLPVPSIVITEVMQNPAAIADSTGEYFEIHNRGSAGLDLDGLVVSDEGNDSFVVTGTLLLGPGAFAVFGRTHSAADGVVDVAYGSSMTLANSSDEIVLQLNGQHLDTVRYGPGFPLLPGRSLERVNEINDADQPASWCAADSELENGDYGSPGRKTLSCLP